MTDNPKRKLAFSVIARSEATTQSHYCNLGINLRFPHPPAGGFGMTGQKL